uniref:Uncharacterized protein n=1 Tax=Leersia perrieri TaxID=77586 RepID=A0A0D9XNL0_9ORYZ
MELDEQQHATERQRCCLMGLQLLNIQNRDHYLSPPNGSRVPIGQADYKDNANGNDNHVSLEDGVIRGDSLKNELDMWEISSIAISKEAKHIVNSREEGKREFGAETTTPDDDYGLHESGMELSLPDSPFSSPIKASIVATEAHNCNINNNSPYMVASSLCPPSIYH